MSTSDPHPPPDEFRPPDDADGTPFEPLPDPDDNPAGPPLSPQAQAAPKFNVHSVRTQVQNLERGARVTVRDGVYYDAPDVKPTQFARPYAYWAESSADEFPPYGPKPTVIRGEWTPIDTGWLDGRVGELCLRNEEGRFKVYPTPAQEKAAAARIVQLGVLTREDADLDDPNPAAPPIRPVARVSPGRSCRFQPEPGQELYVRCLADQARCTLTLFPV